MQWTEFERGGHFAAMEGRHQGPFLLDDAPEYVIAKNHAPLISRFSRTSVGFWSLELHSSEVNAINQLRNAGEAAGIHLTPVLVGWPTHCRFRGHAQHHSPERGPAPHRPAPLCGSGA
jgi:hypothetical protein